mgnify:CR=1 FL=1
MPIGLVNWPLKARCVVLMNCSNVSRSVARAGMPARELVGAQKQHRAPLLLGKRLADAAGVAQDQVALQRAQLVGRNAPRGELPKSRVDAVDGRAAGASASALRYRAMASSVRSWSRRTAPRLFRMPGSSGASSAAWRKDWREATAWIMLVAVFAAIMAWHLSLIAVQEVPSDPVGPDWLVLRGLSGWLGNIVLSSNLRLLPHELASPVVILMALGWAGWKSSAGTTGTFLYLGYGLAFMLAGRANNFYWGAVVAPYGGHGVIALALAFLAFVAVIALFRLREITDEHIYGATTVVAAMLSFALGAFAVIGEPLPAIAGGLAVERLEVHFLGAAQADVDDIAATCREPFDRGLQQLRAAQADVMADDDRSWPQQCRRACADALGQVGVEFIRNPTTDVIGLETRERHQCGPYWGDRRL